MTEPASLLGSALMRNRHLLLFAGVLTALAVGGGLYAFGFPVPSHWVWMGVTAAVLVPHGIAAAQALWRRTLGVDLIAVLAMAGALALGEALAGTILAVMLAGGTMLERYAEGRARRELTALVQRAPRIAHRRNAGALLDIPVDAVAVGDLLVVKPGEVIPTDGILTSPEAVLDESALTGESRPVSFATGSRLRSGASNAGPPLELSATATAAKSTYAAIVRLVDQAARTKAPIVRLADRFAGAFLGLTLLVAGGAWLLSADAVRALAVLVVATPCPLILAAPAAIVAGISRAARHGILFKSGAVLETLSRAQVLLMDKTGTLTAGKPSVVAIESFGGGTPDAVLRAAASLDQMSTHPFVPALLAEAARRNLALVFPTQVQESPGAGIAGNVQGVAVRVGNLGYAAGNGSRPQGVAAVQLRARAEGASTVYVGMEAALAGAIVLQDLMRPEAPRVLQGLRRVGIRSIHMVTGDHPDIAEVIGDAVGVDKVHCERTPEEKVEVVREVRSEGITVMVGDGVNDAPALALADVGVGIGSGAAAASEAAGVVLVADRLEALLLAMRLSQRSRRIAIESIVVGMALSLAAMAAAAAGLLSPIAGAILQEAIDVAVILNALRALGGGGFIRQVPEHESRLGVQLAEAHRTLKPRVDELALLAAQLDGLPPSEARQRLEAVHAFLETELLPHEREEQRNAYPVISAILKEEDPTGPLIQTHNEIARLSRLLGRMVEGIPAEGLTPDIARDLRRALYGLHAVLALHFSQEEELYRMFSA